MPIGQNRGGFSQTTGLYGFAARLFLLKIIVDANALRFSIALIDKNAANQRERECTREGKRVHILCGHCVSCCYFCCNVCIQFSKNGTINASFDEPRTPEVCSRFSMFENAAQKMRNQLYGP